jgi:hypothetical protein
MASGVNSASVRTLRARGYEPVERVYSDWGNAMTINGVSIGDIFMNGKHLKAKVVDFLEQRSLVTGEIVGHVCIAEGLGLATNRFPTPFATVARNKVTK